jgi:hypothetical protein
MYYFVRSHFLTEINHAILTSAGTDADFVDKL